MTQNDPNKSRRNSRIDKHLIHTIVVPPHVSLKIFVTCRRIRDRGRYGLRGRGVFVGVLVIVRNNNMRWIAVPGLLINNPLIMNYTNALK